MRSTHRLEQLGALRHRSALAQRQDVVAPADMQTDPLAQPPHARPVPEMVPEPTTRVPS